MCLETVQGMKDIGDGAEKVVFASCRISWAKTTNRVSAGTTTTEHSWRGGGLGLVLEPLSHS